MDPRGCREHGSCQHGEPLSSVMIYICRVIPNASRRSATSVDQVRTARSLMYISYPCFDSTTLIAFPHSKAPSSLEENGLTLEKSIQIQAMNPDEELNDPRRVSLLQRLNAAINREGLDSMT